MERKYRKVISINDWGLCHVKRKMGFYLSKADCHNIFSDSTQKKLTLVVEYNKQEKERVFSESEIREIIENYHGMGITVDPDTHISELFGEV
jgi:hypothetical protein